MATTNRHDFHGSRIVELRSRALSLNEDNNNFVRMYPADDVSGDTRYFILMSDRGQRVDQWSTTSWSQDKFHNTFRDLWIETTRLSSLSQIYHGDIAHHNILIEKKGGGPFGTTEDTRLVLIDWDEAQKYNPKSREVATCGCEWLQLYWELVNSESLRDHPMLYTEMQLSMLYWRLKSENVDDTRKDFLADL